MDELGLFSTPLLPSYPCLSLSSGRVDSRPFLFAFVLIQGMCWSFSVAWSKRKKAES